MRFESVCEVGPILHKVEVSGAWVAYNDTSTPLQTGASALKTEHIILVLGFGPVPDCDAIGVLRAGPIHPHVAQWIEQLPPKQ